MKNNENENKSHVDGWEINNRKLSREDDKKSRRAMIDNENSLIEDRYRKIFKRKPDYWNVNAAKEIAIVGMLIA